MTAQQNLVVEVGAEQVLSAPTVISGTLLQTKLAAGASRYAQMGFAIVPVKAGTKDACMPAWQTAPLTSTEAVERWWTQHPNDNIGMHLGRSGLVVLDVDDLEATRVALAAIGIGLQELTDASVRLEGNPERAKLVFRAPEGIKLERRVLKWRGPDGAKPLMVFELRGGASQDLLPPSIHPSGKAYKWLSPPPPLNDFPALPERLLDLWLHFDERAATLQGSCPWHVEEAPVLPQRAQAQEFLDTELEDEWTVVRREIRLQFPLEKMLGLMGVTLRGGKACCPFHVETTPSFWVYDSGQGYSIWCDGHGGAPVGRSTPQGYSIGDVIDLYAHHHRKGVGDATIAMAQDLGIPLPKREVLPAPQRPTASPRGFGTLSAVELWKTEFRQQRWAVPGILPEGLTLLAAPPKVGKSFLALSLAIAIAEGSLALGAISLERGKALYVGLEDNPRRLKQRLQMMTQQPPKDLFLETSLARLDLGGLETVRGWLMSNPDARLVVLDTLARIRPPVKGSNAYQDDAAVTASLQELALECEVAILVITHTRKAEAVDAFERVSGTAGITASADATWVLERTRNQNQATLHMTGRDIEEQALAIERDPQTGLWRLVGKDAGVAFASKERHDILNALRTNGESTPRQLAKLLEKNESTTKNMLAKMRDAGLVVAEGGKYKPSDLIDRVDPKEDELG